ncbi:MAG: enoyl-CoA hydratase/isomerase family protein [Gammaproteobacteria bacterium]|nr:enoyl-CoA hydratase/isomerase family protein [Gammaproteobacteria bacterium]
MTTQIIIDRTPNGVYTLCLNRPDRHNAFNAELIDELLTALQQIHADADARVLIVTGKGKSFSAGADLDWMRGSAQYNAVKNRADANKLAQLMRTIYELKVPTIARVNGPAYGGGLGLIACCDIAIAAASAQFAFTEVRLGLVPAVIAPYVLQAIGLRQSRRYFLSAEPFTSTEAHHIGLIHEVAADDKLDERVQHQAGHLLKAGPIALQQCKRMLQQITGNSHNERELVELIAHLRTSPEAQQGMTAFFDKRQPPWIK